MSSTTSKQQKKLLFSRRLNQVLDRLEYPPLHLGRIERLKDVFQVSQTAARKWITGLSLPHYERRKLIAQKLGLCFEWLEQGLGQMLPTTTQKTELVPSYPLCNVIDLAEGDFDSKKNFPCPGPFYSRAFVIQQSFIEMSSRFPLGSFLLVDPCAQLGDGDFILLRLKAAEKNILFRQLKISGKISYYSALGADPILTPISKEDELLGRVIQVIINIPL